MTTTPNTTSHSNIVTVSDLIKHPHEGQTEIFLVRHGQTAANVDRLFVGATDIPLNGLGERQALLVGDRFATIDIDAIVTSPLARAQRTAQAIADVTNLEPLVVPGLSEIDFGHIEGLNLQQVLQQFPELKTQLDDFGDLDLQWPGGESRKAFYQRIMAAFLGIIDRYENRSVAVVCHGGVIGALSAQIGLGPQDDIVRWSVANCSVTHMVVTPENTRIEMWNDISHLDEVQQGPLKFTPSLMDE